MIDYMTKSLDLLAKEILEDGIIDANEVKLIKERIYADGMIDREEANFLFTLNDATSGKENDPSWNQLFVDAIATHVLEDKTSPNVIDEEEATWLLKSIESDGKIDKNEKSLLAYLQKHATKIHPSLAAIMK